MRIMTVCSAQTTRWVHNIQPRCATGVQEHPYDLPNCPHLQQCTHSRNHQKVVQKLIWESHVERAEDFLHSEEGKVTPCEAIERECSRMQTRHAT